MIGLALVPLPSSGQEALRLPATPITVQAKGKGLSKVLVDVGTRAGVRLTAVPHLANKRATVFVQERPLGETMERLAAVWSLPAFPARWRLKQTDEGEAYELWQDPRAEEELQRRLAADRKRIAAGLEALVRLAREGEAQPAANTGDPVLDLALYAPNWKNGLRAQMDLLGELPPRAQSAVVQGETTWIPFAGLSPRAQQTIIGGIGSYSYSNEQDARAGFGPSMLGLQLRLTMDGKTPDWRMFLFTQEPGNRHVTMFGFPVAPLGVSEDEPPAAEQAAVRDDPVGEALLREMPSAARAWKEFADFQQFLGERGQLPIVSDYHHGKKPPALKGLAKAKNLGELLSLAAAPAGYRWRSVRPTVLFRNRYWYLDDQSEVPSEVEQQLQVALAQRGYLRVEELQSAAALNDHQLERLGAEFPQAKELRQYRRLLAWRQALSPRLREASERPEGLRVADSGLRATALLFPGGENVDTLLKAFKDRRALRISIRQVREEDIVWTYFDLIQPQGSWVRYRYEQKVRNASEPP
jgi:hypothetical protein